MSLNLWQPRIAGLYKGISAVLVGGLYGSVFVTIRGTSRYEWEKELPLEEAEELMKLCEPGIIDKTRYLVRSGKHVFEVDEFYGENEGLVVAEIELESEEESFVKPDFLCKEVPGDVRYYNSQLMKKPYKTW